MSNKNPWRGLASYEENDGYLFCGRDEETLDVVRLIDNNLFVTLYGSSGIGKTSLLKAGVIPILRRKDYYPLYVRLSQEPKKLSYAEAIVEKLKNSGLNDERTVALNYPDGSDRLYLWNYFATTRFRNAEGREVYPVIILDQFEEVFRDADKRKADLLLQQVYLLLNDELEMPDSEGYSTDTNYRFVASIREDFLFVLEDSIDELSMDLYKDNRYRLRPMKPEKAKEVVLMPGKDCIEESEKNKVVERMVSLAQRNEQGDIDTLLLSLVCSSTYDKKKHEKISLEDLNIWKDKQGNWIDNPMEVYYQDAIKGLSTDQVRFIQQHLVHDDGSRKQVDAEEVKEALGKATYIQLTQSTNRLFAFGNMGKVELLHDQLAMAVYEERKAFEERERKKRLRQKTILYGAVGLLFFVLTVFYLQQNRKLISQSNMLNEQTQKLFKSQTAYVIEKFNSSTNNDSYLSRLLALEVLPRQISNPDRPCTIEAEMMLRKAASSNTGVVRWANSIAYFIHDGKHFVTRHRGDGLLVFETATGVCIDTIEGIHTNLAISSDGRFIVSISDNNILLWDSTYCKIDTLCKHNQRIISVSLSPDGNRIVTTSEDSMIRIWDIAGMCIDSMIVFCPNKLWRVGLENTTFSPDGKWIVPIVRASYACVFDGNLNCIDTLHGIGGYNITQIGFTSNCKRIIGANATNVLIWDWDGKKAKCIDTISLSKIQPGNGMIDYVNLSQDGNYIIIGSHAFQNDKKMKKDSHNEYMLSVLNSQGNIVRQIDLENNINTAFLSPDNRIILSATNNQVRIDNLIPDEEDMLTYRDLTKSYGANSATYSLDGRTILVSNGSLLDADNGNLIDNQKCLVNLSGGFSSDGKYILLAPSRTLYVFDTTGNMLLKKKSMQDVSYATFCPDNKSVLAISNAKEETSGNQTSTITIWDISTGDSTIKTYVNRVINYVCFSHIQPYDTFYYPDTRASSYTTAKKTSNATQYAIPSGKIAISSNDKYIAIQKAPSVIGIWNLDKWKTGCQDFDCGRIVRPHYGANTIAFSPDERFLLVATRASTLLYDVNTGQELLRLSPGQAAISASFSPDGKHILSILNGNILRLYDFPPLQELIDQTRERFKDRPLTDEERRMYYLEK